MAVLFEYQWWDKVSADGRNVILQPTSTKEACVISITKGYTKTLSGTRIQKKTMEAVMPMERQKIQLGPTKQVKGFQHIRICRVCNHKSHRLGAY